MSKGLIKRRNSSLLPSNCPVDTIVPTCFAATSIVEVKRFVTEGAQRCQAGSTLSKWRHFQVML
ncbi:hypothetical protein PBN151_4850 [Paenibacillus sp. NAIST15-1]|nr:hypothetical protein PBN151_4850 [Paenibacillus sp. NAIST15-1]